MAKRIEVSITVSKTKDTYNRECVLKCEKQVEKDFEVKDLKTYGLSLLRDIKSGFVTEIEEMIEKEEEEKEKLEEAA